MKLKTLFLVVVLSRLTFAASYSVPVPEDLEDVAIWKNISATASISGDVLSIQYALPEDLVGKDQLDILAKGTVNGNFAVMSGLNVKGTCMISREKPLLCMLHYPERIVEVVSRDQALSQHFSGLDFVRRSKVARLFGADPAGLLTVDLH